MWYLIRSYISFLLRATNQHGVHSPFVYNLVTKCFYDKKKHPAYSDLESYREALYKNNDSLLVTDFGSGSRIFKSNIRPISKIAKTAGTTKKRAQLLFRITQYFKSKDILELGTSLGIATQAMAIANNNSILSIEGCPNIAAFTKKQLSKFNIENASVRIGAFENILPNIKKENYDLIFFDGNHNKEATLQYFNTLITKAHNDTVFIFDDIHWSKSMTEAWETIKLHTKVTVTIDTFFWGLVFFRKEQEKQHFKIRM